MKQITKRQQSVLDYIKHCIRSGMPPSVREISDYMELSKTGARCHIKALEKKGYIYLVPRQARNIRLTARDTGAGNISYSGGGARNSGRVGARNSGRGVPAIPNT